MRRSLVLIVVCLLILLTCFGEFAAAAEQGEQTFALSVSTVGDGSGYVVSNPDGIDCGGTCIASFPAGTQTLLIARADEGSRFVGWTGACEGNAWCPVLMDAEKAVTAFFERIHYDYNLGMSIRLRRHLTAIGELTSNEGIADCVRNRKMSLQQRVSGSWTYVKTLRTRSTGGYRVDIPDRAGSVRLKVAKLVLDEYHICLGGQLVSLPHSH
jgi:hypothetical protein